MVRIRDLLQIAFERKASDLHITPGAPPVLRIHGKLRAIDNAPLTPDLTLSMARELLTEEQFVKLEETGEIDFSFGVPRLSRFRVNAFRQRGTYSLAIRVVPQRIPSLEELGMPEVVKMFAQKAQGLVLVTGPTGSGKSTTLAAMIDFINQNYAKHIVTLEDPIEYIHKHSRSIVDQREIGLDTMSFANGLRAALRQDPDVILVGEMRDYETISTALTAAETGHLVLATLHTQDAPQTIDRIIDVFGARQQQQIRIQLASVLLGVISQRLLPAANGDGRVAAVETLVNTPAVANLIRSEKVYQVKTMMQTGKQFGMQTMQSHIKELVAKRLVEESSARELLALCAEE
jgi:twitching motility protein PilT